MSSTRYFRADDAHAAPQSCLAIDFACTRECFSAIYLHISVRAETVVGYAKRT